MGGPPPKPEISPQVVFEVIGKIEKTEKEI